MNYLHQGWTPSTREELLFVMYTILTVLCFAHDYTVAGWIFSIKAATCLIAAVVLALQEIKSSRKGGAA